MGGGLFFCPKQEKVNNAPHKKYSIVNKCPVLGKYFLDLVDIAPNRGYNEIAVKEKTKDFPETGQEEKTMKEIVWQEFNKSDRLVTKRKTLKTVEALEKFIEKLTEKDNFYTILATR